MGSSEDPSLINNVDELGLVQRRIDATSFALSSRCFLFKSTNNFDSVFPHIVWIVEFKRSNSRNTSAFFFSILHLSYDFNFSFNAQNLPFIRDCSHVIALPVYR